MCLTKNVYARSYEFVLIRTYTEYLISNKPDCTYGCQNIGELVLIIIIVVESIILWLRKTEKE